MHICVCVHTFQKPRTFKLGPNAQGERLKRKTNAKSQRQNVKCQMRETAEGKTNLKMHKTSNGQWPRANGQSPKPKGQPPMRETGIENLHGQMRETAGGKKCEMPKALPIGL